MTPAEAAALLGVAAAFDRRKPDADAAKAWAVALARYGFDDCRDAIVEHYRASSDFLMPNHIIAQVKRVRTARLRAAGDLTPPRGLSDAEEVEWLQAERRRIGDGLPPSAPTEIGGRDARAAIEAANVGRL